MQMALSRGANGFRREAGGVDEPARATDVFYALSPTSLVARCSFSPVKDTGMRFAESSPRPTIAIRGRKNSAPRRRFCSPRLSLSLSLSSSRSLLLEIYDSNFTDERVSRVRADGDFEK